VKDGSMPPPIFFFIPNSTDWSELPTDMQQYWAWMRAQGHVAWWGQFNWTLQTYLRLRAEGFCCGLAREIPAEGIVVAHRDFLPTDLRPSRRQLMVCLLADRNRSGSSGRHPYAQIHVVQNPHDDFLTHASPGWRAYYMPQWPQPGLLPRDPDRGDRFEVAAFFGYEHNLAPELRNPQWTAQLRDLGLIWRSLPRHQWHDYRDVDVVIAVRKFGYWDFSNKPPSKLYNCWHAGVPAVLGAESAFRANRRSDLDYLEVQSLEETAAAIRRLRDDPDMRQRMIRNGFTRAQEVHPARLAEQWQRLFTEAIVPAYGEWADASPWARAMFRHRRAWAFRHRRVATGHAPGRTHAQAIRAFSPSRKSP
jgi:hypothetical protein